MPPSVLRKRGREELQLAKRPRVAFANPQAPTVIGAPSSPDHPWGVRRKACKRRTDTTKQLQNTRLDHTELEGLKGALASRHIPLPCQTTQYQEYNVDEQPCEQAIDGNADMDEVSIQSEPVEEATGLESSAFPVACLGLNRPGADLEPCGLMSDGGLQAIHVTNFALEEAKPNEVSDAHVNHSVVAGGCADAISLSHADMSLFPKQQEAVTEPSHFFSTCDEFSGTFDSDPFGVLPARRQRQGGCPSDAAFQSEMKVPADDVRAPTAAEKAVLMIGGPPASVAADVSSDKIVCKLRQANADLLAELSRMQARCPSEAARQEEVESVVNAELASARASNEELTNRLAACETEVKTLRQRCKQLEDAEARACGSAETERKTNRDLLRCLDKTKEQLRLSAEAERSVRNKAERDARALEHSLQNRIELQARVRDALETLKFRDDELDKLRQSLQEERRTRDQLTADLNRLSACSEKAETNERNAQCALNASAARHAADLEQRMAAHTEARQLAYSMQRLQAWLAGAGQIMTQICSFAELSNAEFDLWADVLGREFVHCNRSLLSDLGKGCLTCVDYSGLDCGHDSAMQPHVATWSAGALQVINQLNGSSRRLLAELGLGSAAALLSMSGLSSRCSGKEVESSQVNGNGRDATLEVRTRSASLGRQVGPTVSKYDGQDTEPSFCDDAVDPDSAADIIMTMKDLDGRSPGNDKSLLSSRVTATLHGVAAGGLEDMVGEAEQTWQVHSSPPKLHAISTLLDSDGSQAEDI